ncbi:YbjQ family protein [Synechococcus sp. CCY9201]|uniref:YbjQ family protein n=1 Tax=Synechococcus sp. CCY9201 TaxID=174697 RepID=UPI002B209FC0|nr:YbjQ family protein [Synechococcus sp. CCY9201]MEA5474588.1 YbjQ family protein [Synechococcus sp. CCY9201]
MVKPVFVTTTFTIEGYAIREYKGIVRGIVVRSPTLIQGFLGGLKSMIGGRIGAYTEMCEQTRQQAYDQMVAHARQLGANAIVGTRYDGSEVESGATGATEVLCYGTAVVVERLAAGPPPLPTSPFPPT